MLGVYFIFPPVFELQWILVLLVLRFDITRRPVSEASEHNKDSLSLTRAHSLKVGMDALHTIRAAAYLARSSKSVVENKTERKERGKREKKKKEGGE